ncbi:hypothetical protein EL48_01695 [Salmonella enterica subsp. enterica serovar Choleraesuis]|nr:hypothetical protein EL48_01695 [Salmonella enterica subsp. enterica serovar Choleraesuis]
MGYTDNFHALPIVKEPIIVVCSNEHPLTKTFSGKNCDGFRFIIIWHSLTTAYPTTRTYRRVANYSLLIALNPDVFLHLIIIACEQPLSSFCTICVECAGAPIIKLHFVEVSNLFKLRLWQLVSLAYRFTTLKHGSATGVPCSHCKSCPVLLRHSVDLHKVAGGGKVHFFRHYRH